MRKRTDVRWRLAIEALLWVAVILLPGGVLLLPVAIGVHRARLAAPVAVPSRSA